EAPSTTAKRVSAPKSWLRTSWEVVFAPRPSTGPHKRRGAFPVIMLRKPTSTKRLLNGLIAFSTRMAVPCRSSMGEESRRLGNTSVSFMTLRVVSLLTHITDEESQDKKCKL
ncbi:uncharacterized protein LOC134789216, partial [Penaeus indicus]|uniref:uncharacterized protein LOC134789216 n=1 Tax=Penaeus indicus TaxID=29960 RepID=UPI00300C09D5